MGSTKSLSASPQHGAQTIVPAVASDLAPSQELADLFLQQSSPVGGERAASPEPLRAPSPETGVSLVAEAAPTRAIVPVFPGEIWAHIFAFSDNQTRLASRLIHPTLTPYAEAHYDLQIGVALGLLTHGEEPGLFGATAVLASLRGFVAESAQVGHDDRCLRVLKAWKAVGKSFG